MHRPEVNTGKFEPDVSENAALRALCAQAVASARLEGFEPDLSFLADLDEVAAGRMSLEEARARAIAKHRARLVARGEVAID